MTTADTSTTHTPSGTPVATIERMEWEARRAWGRTLCEASGKPECLEGYGEGPTHCTFPVGHRVACNHL